VDADDEVASLSPKLEEAGRGEFGDDVTEEDEQEGDAGDKMANVELFISCSIWDGAAPPPIEELRRVEVAVIADVLKDTCE